VDTVDKITEAVWCDHVEAKGTWLHGKKPAICISCPKTHIVIEEGKVKILCQSCYFTAVLLLV
jgi:hypothetical protein